MLFAKKYIDENITLAPTLSNEYLKSPDGFVVTVVIEATTMLNTLTDRLRMSEGLRPMFKERGNLDKHGWYEYYAVCTKHQCIQMYAVPRNTTAADNNRRIELPLAEKQKSWLFDRIVSLIGDLNWNAAFCTKEWRELS